MNKQCNINRQSAIGNRRSMCGFTLIELLVVVMIICVLAAIMVPAILQAMTASKRRATQGRVNALDSACRVFADDMSGASGGSVALAWQPNTPYAVGAVVSANGNTYACMVAHTSSNISGATFSNDPAADWQLSTQTSATSGVTGWPPTTYTGPAGPAGAFPSDGAHALVLWLTGYGPDSPHGSGIPTGDMLNADGKDGYGFRLTAQGRVYGPYGGAENFDTMLAGVNGSGAYPVFVDAWGGTIQYGGGTPGGYEPVTAGAGYLIWSQPPASATQYDPTHLDPTSHQPMPMLITNVTSIN